MSAEVEDDDEGFVRKKRVMPSTDVDITPMIDLTFQLLIFFKERQKLNTAVNVAIFMEAFRR